MTGVSQAASVAAVTLNPRNFKKSRRLVEDSSIAEESARNLSTGTYSLNSLSRCFRKAGLSFSSSKPFQYFLELPILVIAYLYVDSGQAGNDDLLISNGI